MNLRVLFLVPKLIVLVSMIFANTIDMVLILAGILIILIALPKVKGMLDSMRYSGYMKSSDGVVYIVKEKGREAARAQGFTELPMLASMFHPVVAKEWHPGKVTGEVF